MHANHQAVGTLVRVRCGFLGLAQHHSCQLCHCWNDGIAQHVQPLLVVDIAEKVFNARLVRGIPAFLMNLQELTLTTTVFRLQLLHLHQPTNTKQLLAHLLVDHGPGLLHERSESLQIGLGLECQAEPAGLKANNTAGKRVRCNTTKAPAEVIATM